VQVRLLGPLEVIDDGGDRIEIRGSRLRALLVRLALDAGRPLTVEVLADSLWDLDSEPADTANAVQSLVSRLRRTLPAPETLESGPGGYRLAVAAAEVDALAFRELVQRSRSAARTGAPDAGRHVADALALWRGPALVDVGDAPFATVVAAALEAERVTALEERLAADLAAGRGREVMAEIEALVNLDPLRESAVALLMRARHDAGRAPDALAAYEQLRLRLAEELGTDPSPALQELHLQALRGELVAPGPAPAGPVARNLPASFTSFLGRDEELRRLANLLATERLVTLVGPGGAGKTRLAVEAARQIVDRPVCLVELAPVTDADDLAQAVLDALDLREVRLGEPSQRAVRRDALTRVTEALSTGPTVLVLDNCEHLVEAAAEVAEHLLRRCPQLVVVATSREALAVTGEFAFPVRALSRPDPAGTLDEVGGTASVRLFVDRAQATRPGFVLDTSTRAAVVEVCRRLDGLPLAIELAAARLRTMTVEALADRLDDRFRLLTGGTRTAVARHRTLRAVVEWSWDLLTDAEREVADRFSVFPGGATADATWQVCLGGQGRRTEAEDLLGLLVDKSLLQLVPPGPGGETRYRMLETLREYGVARLADAGTLATTRRAHATYYRDLAERAEPLLRTGEQLHWMAVLDRERDNILAALRFAADDRDADTAVRVAAALGWYWLTNDNHAEAASWFETALAVPGHPDAGALALVRGLYIVASLASNRIAFSDIENLKLMIAQIPEVDPLAGHPLLTLLAPATALLTRDFQSWPVSIEHNLRHPDPWARGLLYLFRGQIHENRGDVSAELADVEEALCFFRGTGDRWGMSMSLHGVGSARLLSGDLDGAADAFQEALTLVTELATGASDEVELTLRLATVRHRAGDGEGAHELLDRAARAAAQSTSRQAKAIVALTRALVDLDDGDLSDARARCEEAALHHAQAAPAAPQLEAMLLATQAALDLAEGRTDGVRACLERAVAAAHGSWDMPVMAMVAVVVTQWLQATDRTAAAAEMLGTAAALRGSPDSTNPMIITLTGRLQEALGADAYDAGFGAGAALEKDLAADRVGAAVASERG
jgi:predicted ATPase/DNA-binding SARP family transcriptional activator